MTRKAQLKHMAKDDLVNHARELEINNLLLKKKIRDIKLIISYPTHYWSN